MNIALLFAEAARAAPRAPFLIGEAEAVSYGEAERQSAAVSRALLAAGIGAGAPVALLFPNTPAQAIAQLGVLRAGAVPVLLSLAAPAPEIAASLDTVGAVALLADPSCAEAGRAGAAGAPRCALVVDDLMAFAADVAADVADGVAARAASDAALILFTSGTTGRPKGAVVTHANVRHFADFFVREFWRVGPSDVLLMLAPNAHVIGQCVLWTACAAGAAVRTMQGFTPERLVRAVERDRVTMFAGVPALGRFLLASPALDGAELGSLRTVMLGGAPVEPDLVAALEARLGARVLPGYGMTEAAPISYVSPDVTAPPGSVGRPVWGCEVRVVDADGADVPTGERGEVWVRGPQVFAGYHGDPDAGWTDGWFRTGDVGVLDADGFLTLVDRLKHLIKTGGYAVFAAEVERALLSHPAVAEAAVVGRPHATLGETVRAVVALRDGAVASATDLSRHCKTLLASYKAPRTVSFVERLPRSRTGKVDRHALADVAS